MKFPKTLYVKIEKDSVAEYFSAADNAAELVEMGDKVNVATYQLMDVREARGVAEFKPPMRKR